MRATTFTCSGIQTHCEVLSVEGVERLSAPYSYRVRVLGRIDVEASRDGAAVLELETTDGHTRVIGGVVQRIAMGVRPATQADERFNYDLSIVPLTYRELSLRHGYRIFQELTVPEIVDQIVADAGLDASILRWETNGTYAARDYCVQYDESEWDFVCRLLEEEGIWFAFEHAVDATVMVLADTSESAPRSFPAVVDHAFSDSDAEGFDPHWRWRRARALRPVKITLNDYDYENPSRPLAKEASGDGPGDREVYEYPGRFADPERGAGLAQVRLDEQRCLQRRAEARTFHLGLIPGTLFELVGHPLDSGEHFVLESRMSFSTTSAGDSDGSQTIWTIPKEQPYRPPRRTPRPRPCGLQTATVCGPSGQELHTDDLGRIKVQFRWDRDGELDEHSSCWLRVAQPHTTGSVMIPRIGWEVLVEFADGDPDRPVCLGKVWNPSFPPPANLPADKNQTHHASQTTPGGAGTNQIAFDDTAGSERIDVNACHDVLVKVANNKTSSVGTNATHNVTGNRSVSVGATDSTTVGSNHNAGVTGNHTISVGGNRVVKCSGSIAADTTTSYSLSVGGMWNIMVGNPIAAVMQVIAAEAIQAASGAAAGAASRATGALLGPITPALTQAREAVGPAMQFAGPAAGILGGGDPAAAMFGNAAGALSNVPGAADAAGVAAGMAHAQVSGALAGAAAAALGPDGGSGGGGGNWNTTVGADVSETIGGLAAINSARGVTFSIAGDLTETVGAARLELIKGGKAETTSAAKAETVGVYKLDIAESLAITAKAALALSVAGSEKQSISGGYSISSDGPVVISAPQLKMTAGTQITFKVGDCKLILKSGTVAVDGDAKLDIKGSSEVKLKENLLG